MPGGDDLALPYPWIMRNDVTIRGKWMYPRDAVPTMVGLAAVAHAARAGGAFRLTVIAP